MILAVEERVVQALMQTGSTDPTLLNLRSSFVHGGDYLYLARGGCGKRRSSSRHVLWRFRTPRSLLRHAHLAGSGVVVRTVDHIHHRGQISVYMRLAGAKLPSIYGPTADEPMSAGA